MAYKWNMSVHHVTQRVTTLHVYACIGVWRSINMSISSTIIVVLSNLRTRSTQANNSMGGFPIIWFRSDIQMMMMMILPIDRRWTISSPAVQRPQRESERERERGQHDGFDRSICSIVTARCCIGRPVTHSFMVATES